MEEMGSLQVSLMGGRSGENVLFSVCNVCVYHYGSQKTRIRVVKTESEQGRASFLKEVLQYENNLLMFQKFGVSPTQMETIDQEKKGLFKADFLHAILKTSKATSGGSTREKEK